MTNTVKLRAMEPEDLDMLYKIENDRKLWDVGVTNVPYSRYVLHDYIANSSGDIYTDHQVRLIIENGVGETVGLTDLTNFDAKNLRAEFGIVIASNHRRCGYARKALLEVLSYAKQVLHLHQLYAVIDQTNVAAVSLFKKEGFTTQNVLSEWLFDGRKYHDAVLMQRFL